MGIEYKDVNVLEDDAIRQGIKDFSDWPTIPQLYVKGEFVGGCDIVTEMTLSGELDQMFDDKGIGYDKDAANKIREANGQARPSPPARPFLRRRRPWLRPGRPVRPGSRSDPPERPVPQPSAALRSLRISAGQARPICRASPLPCRPSCRPASNPPSEASAPRATGRPGRPAPSPRRPEARPPSAGNSLHRPGRQRQSRARRWKSGPQPLASSSRMGVSIAATSPSSAAPVP
eukprot:TRINITY_DN40297_c0_g1_i1.p1 TRINITY_DN40297_c0_g1~~TRINITY_DN40297_c0_g1_i1.p1  ORF type:complete len:232 (-),score=42.43 TRINITY_DN40297_c0_g1_i1:30-725(-)